MPLVGRCRPIVDHQRVVLMLPVARTDRPAGSRCMPAIDSVRPASLRKAMDILFDHIHSTLCCRWVVIEVGSGCRRGAARHHAQSSSLILSGRLDTAADTRLGCAPATRVAMCGSCRRLMSFLLKRFIGQVSVE